LGYHGLPVELGTEKNLELQRRYWTKLSKEYNEACKKTVMHTDVWNDLTEKWAIG
jgi:isoleucyl-tRNA synthetase